jgi:DNA-binding NtrC family response regulator
MDSFRGAVTQLLGVYNDVDEAIDLATARKALQSKVYDVVILDKGLPDGDGMSLISEIKTSTPNAVVIMLTSDSDFSSVKHCMSRGADDYVVKSENVVPDLLVRIPFAVSRAASNNKLESLKLQVKEAFKYEIVGKSEPTMKLRETILDLKDSRAHVLITGESGTGKELIARRLNAIEDDGTRPFVAINCGAIPENLIESELFGHKKGAFTDATQDRSGRFEIANNGDLFLDEIGELPLAAQVKLLRVIQEGEFTRVGDSRVIKVSCRIIAATNQNIEEMIKKNKFREDLYHRLNVIRIQTTPLAARMEDISDMAKLFVLQIGGPNYKINDRAIRALKDHDWPGNVRELRNALERAIISARRRKSDEIIFDDISIHIPINEANYRIRKIESVLPVKASDITPENFQEFMESAEKEYFRSALESVDGSVAEVANRVGMGRSTVFRRLKALGCGQVSDKKQIKFTDKSYLDSERELTQ